MGSKDYEERQFKDFWDLLQEEQRVQNRPTKAYFSANPFMPYHDGDVIEGEVLEVVDVPMP